MTEEAGETVVEAVMEAAVVEAAAVKATAVKAAAVKATAMEATAMEATAMEATAMPSASTMPSASPCPRRSSHQEHCRNHGRHSDPCYHLPKHDVPPLLPEVFQFPIQGPASFPSSWNIRDPELLGVCL
jgi:hypothetical protein